MTNPILRAFHADDAKAILNRDGKQAEAESTLLQAAQGPSFTAEYDGVVLGCGGVVLMWPGVGACWMMLAEDIGSHGLWLSRTTRHFLATVKREANLHRLEAMAMHESVRNQAWLELCGFKREQNGIAQSYLPDKRSMVRFELVED